MDATEKKGNIIIPQFVKDANTPIPSTGIVLVLGDKLREDCGLREGDGVMFSRYAGTESAIEGETFRILDFSEIMCTLEPTNPEAYAVTVD